jgi:hypothetical protein
LRQSAHSDAIREDARRGGLNDGEIDDAVQNIMNSWAGSETYTLVRQASEAARKPEWMTHFWQHPAQATEFS